MILTLLAGASALQARPRVDFDGDGFADLAVGVPHEDVGAQVDAGAINVLYGSEDSLTAARSQFFTQGTRRVPGQVQAGAQFGQALAVGDFNADGFTDLAVGAPGADLPRLPDSGVVVIFYGGEGGLSPSRSRLLVWLNRNNSRFGAALAAGDFDGDGFVDLAVGAPDYVREPEDTPGSGRGAVLVWYGSRFGMRTRQVWTQDSRGIRDTAEYRDQFGAALATGDFNCDGNADLAVGAPGEAGVASLPSGAVSVLYGSGQGLTSVGNQIWTQNTDGAGDEAQEGDRYGEVLGRGDFDGDGCDELVVGAPGDHTVHVISGTVNGLVSDDARKISGPFRGFVSADLDNDNLEDLAIADGVSGVRIFSGDQDGGLQTSGWFELNEFWMPGLNSDDGSQKLTARAGSSLAADDFEGHGVFDLAVGIPLYDVLYKHNLLQIPNAGAVAVFTNIQIQLAAQPGGIGLSSTPIIQWSPELDAFEGYAPSIHEVGGLAEPEDNFGEVFSR
jgi:hypothetical protein